MKSCPATPNPDTSQYRWTGYSRNGNTLSRIARS